MRQIILLLSVVLFSAVSEAKAPLIEVLYTKGKQSHAYSVTAHPQKKAAYLLSFVDEKKKKHKKVINAAAFDMMRRRATRLLWQNQYRSPAMECKEYMSLKVGKDKTRVCRGNTLMVGRAMGLLDQLNEKFR